MIRAKLCRMGTAAALAAMLALGGCATTPEEEPEKPESKVEQLSALREQLSQDPDNAALHYEYGNLLFDMGNYAEASTAYQATIEHDPQHFKAYVNLGVTMSVLDNPKAAVGAFETALDIQPDDIEALRRLISAAQDAGDTQRVLDAAARLAELNPENPDVVAGYGGLLMKEGYHAEAAEVYQRVIAIDDSVPGDHYNLGLCQYNLMQFDEAEASWKRALAIMPELPEANRGLAVLYWEQGRYEESWEQVRACMQMGIPIEPEFLKALEADSPQGVGGYNTTTVEM